MAKQQLNEQAFIIDFVKRIFDAIVRSRNVVIQRELANDPEFRSIVRKIKEGHDEMLAWAEDKAKTDPIFAKHLQTQKNIGNI